MFSKSAKNQQNGIAKHPEGLIKQGADSRDQKESEMTGLRRYFLGYRTAPLLQITPGMGGTNSRGIKDFLRFLLGYRGYIRIEKRKY